MGIHNLAFVLLFATSIVSADVSISGAYYTGGTESREEVFLHDMDYSNSVSIDQASFNAASNANASDDSGKGSFGENARMLGAFGFQGVGIVARAENLGYSRSLVGGESQSMRLSYFLESGTAHASYFSPRSIFNEEIVLDNCRYEGDVQVHNARTYSLGYGTPVLDAPSSFSDNISMIYLDKQCRLWSSLISFGEASGDIPVSYKLRSYSGERNFARAGIGIGADQGNRYMNLSINGTATILGDKSSPDPKVFPFLDTFPLQYKPISQGEQRSRDLLVEYNMAAGTSKNLSEST